MVAFRFSVEPYNFQFCAAFPETETCRRIKTFQHDYFSEENDIVTCTSNGAEFQAVLRQGWKPLNNGAREIDGKNASIYLLNHSAAPLRLEIHGRVTHSSGFSTVRIRLGSHVLCELNLSSDQREQSFELDEVYMPGGGQHLFLDIFPGGPKVRISNIHISVEKADTSELTETLPFDLYQRYAAASKVAQILDPARIIDIGGYLGDQNGHLATSSDFLAHDNEVIVRSTDLRQCDHPAHEPADGCTQPFPDGAFDMAISLDVLEHLPQQSRNAFLRELDRLARTSILIGAPFWSEAVEEEEERLSDLVQLAFLKEHRELGLPKESDITEFFQEKLGYEVISIPNGFLPRWSELQLLTQIFFSLHDYRIAQTFNQLHNRFCFEDDFRRPSYRTLFVVSKAGFTTQERDELEKLGSGNSTTKDCREAVAMSQDFLSLFSRIMSQFSRNEQITMDLQFLINEREKHVRILQDHIQKLEQKLAEDEHALSRLLKRAARKLGFTSK
jgi:hypothetical protein